MTHTTTGYGPTKRLRPHHRAQVQQALVIINHYKMEVQRMEAAIERMLQQEYGANFATEQWEFDSEKGTLRQVITTIHEDDADVPTP